MNAMGPRHGGVSTDECLHIPTILTMIVWETLEVILSLWRIKQAYQNK